MIHPSAIIDPSAQIAENVEVGPWTYIGPHVEISEGTWIGPHVVIKGPTRIGKDNKIFQFSSIGEDPQDKKYDGEKSSLEIGDKNVIREFVTINRGTELGGGITKIGNDNLFMAYVHIAHDCIVANHTIFANNATLAGHVIVDDYARFSGFSAATQFCSIGAHSFIGKSTMVSKDVLPYILVSGYEGAACGLNKVGLQRHGFSPETINYLKRAYKIIFRNSLTVSQALEQLNELIAECPEVKLFIDALQASTRGIVR